MVITAWTIAALLALLGLWLLLRIAFTRTLAHGACRHCGYDCSTLSAPTCPECGRPPNLTKRARKRRPWLLAPIAILLFLPLLALLFPSRTAKLIPHLLPARETLESRTINKTTLRLTGRFNLPTWLDDRLRRLHIELEPSFGDHILQVTHPGAPRIEINDYHINFGTTETQQTTTTSLYDTQSLRLKDAPTTDLDADNIPDLLIVSYSGGAHCCWTYRVLSLADTPAITLELHANNGASFTRTPDSTIIETIDSVWDYWNACYACSYKPTVSLRFSHATLTLAPELMAKPLPAAPVLAAAETTMHKALQARTTSLGPTKDLVPDPEFWHVPLELLYSGHEPEALALIRRAWPDEIPGREAFLNDFTKNFESSPWCAQMRQAFVH